MLGGLISFVHPSQRLEEECNFEILGVGGKHFPGFQYFVHLRYAILHLGLSRGTCFNDL